MGYEKQVFILCALVTTAFFTFPYFHKGSIKIGSTYLTTAEENIAAEKNAPETSFTSNPFDGTHYDETLHRLYRVVDGKKAVNTSEMKYILFWDTFYGNESMNLGFGSDIFKRCPVKSCFTTHNHSYMPVEEFDAIIFYSGRWNSVKDGVPQKRSKKQKYIFYSVESPFNTYFDNTYLNNFYNWTLNHRRDSDIHFPYRMFYKKNVDDYQLPTKDDLKHKSKMAMAMISNCVTHGIQRRENFIRELKKYIDVDIYGKCGKLQCGNDSNCRSIMENQYFFYLAFENSQSLDYVTEKMFDTMMYNIIPVVFGNADYKYIAPEHSVIDVKEFPTAKHLADYLKRLTNNLTEYLEYLIWKKKYYVDASREYATCQLCDMLHQPLEDTSYIDVKKWYFDFNSYL